MSAPTTEVRIFGPAYQEATAVVSHGNECVVCGKRTGKARWFVNVDNGPEWFGDDMGWHPIGPDCAKRARAAGWECEQLEVRS